MYSDTLSLLLQFVINVTPQSYSYSLFLFLSEVRTPSWGEGATHKLKPSPYPIFVLRYIPPLSVTPLFSVTLVLSPFRNFRTTSSVIFPQLPHISLRYISAVLNIL